MIVDYFGKLQRIKDEIIINVNDGYFQLNLKLKKLTLVITKPVNLILQH